MKNDKYVQGQLISLWFEGFNAGLHSDKIGDHLKHRKRIIDSVMKKIKPRLNPDLRLPEIDLGESFQAGFERASLEDAKRLRRTTKTQ